VSSDIDTSQEFNDALVAQGDSLLSEAIGVRLVSDVTLGTITSGGLDSSLTTAMAIRLAKQPLDTFCVGFADPAFDERPFGRDVARHVGSKHHDIAVTADDMAREFERLTWAHDEPLTHPNSIPMHLIFRYAKEQAGVTVVLSGEGADELFGGYAWYANMRRRELLRSVPGLGTALSAAPWSKAKVVRKVLAADYPLVANAVLENETVRALLPNAHDYVADRKEFWPSGLSELDALFRYDQRVYLPPLLQRQDRMAMAAGVEARVVFLDHLLVDWANSLRARVKLKGGERKALLKRIGERWLPRSIVHRRKVGFTVPLDHWMRSNGPLSARVDRLRERDSFVRSVIDSKALDRLLQQHDAGGGTDHGDMVWTLASLETWSSVFLGSQLHRFELPGVATGKRTTPELRPGDSARGVARG
jgi:asparagine synthase (glutamine-hydrolysing)